jgi:hypothetical protein
MFEKEILTDKKYHNNNKKTKIHFVKEIITALAIKTKRH